jgi:hypothetical protein
MGVYIVELGNKLVEGELHNTIDGHTMYPEQQLIE